MPDNNYNQGLATNPQPDFSKIVERPRKSTFKKVAFLILKIVLILLAVLIIAGVILAAIFYNNIKQSYALSMDARNKLESAIHLVINRDFKGGADLLSQANADLVQVKSNMDKASIFNYIPYVGRQTKAVNNVLVAGINLSDSGNKVLLLIDDITAPLKNESITFSTITPKQKRQILEKIVSSEAMLLEVQKEIDASSAAIDEIPDTGLIAPLRDNIAPLKTNLPKVKDLIDHALPMLKVIPQIAGFDKPISYLFLIQNNSELRPTGGFIGTYGVLKLQDGEIKSFQTDNVYNLDQSTQPILKEPSPLPIAKYLEQKNWSLRDINWSPDFPTTAAKALYMYEQENKILADLKKQGKTILSEKNVVITDTIPYEKVDGVFAVTPEIVEDLLKLTGPITVDGVLFTSDNLVDQLEYIVGQEFIAKGIPASQRKEIIMQLADQIRIKLFSLPIQRYADILDIATNSLSKKAILIYFIDPTLEEMILVRNWGGQVQSYDGDYLMVVDSNLASLKTDQYVDRTINYSLNWKNNDLVAKVSIVYKNNADFTWKSTRLRSYTRVYVPEGSQLISSSGAMENDKIKDPAHTPGQVESSSELGKTYFGAFISIEPHEVGTLTFEYKLPDSIKNQINSNYYRLLIQKQPGVIPNLTLTLNFGKNIKSALPAEAEREWFNNSYNYSSGLDQDSEFKINF
jgi:archaellum component FlaF (FlaF/FlaG flagellin family)